MRRLLNWLKGLFKSEPVVVEEEWNLGPDGEPSAPPPFVRSQEMGFMPAAPAEVPSAMTQAILDAGLPAVDDTPIPAFKTNQGTIYLGSPADLQRAALFEGYDPIRIRGMRYVSDTEIDKLMDEEGDDPSKWHRR